MHLKNANSKYISENKVFSPQNWIMFSHRAPEHAYSAEQWLANKKFDYPFNIFILSISKSKSHTNYASYLFTYY